MGIRIALTIALLSAGWAAFTPAAAHPPTVTISPGYDARLSESRKALARPAYEVPSSRTGRTSKGRSAIAAGPDAGKKKGRVADVAARPSLFSLAQAVRPPWHDQTILPAIPAR
ncbi:MAG: hypothetical protein ACTHM2_01690 [Afipia sp.]